MEVNGLNFEECIKEAKPFMGSVRRYYVAPDGHPRSQRYRDKQSKGSDRKNLIVYWRLTGAQAMPFLL